METILEYKFKNKELLKEALTHPSMCYRRNKKINYQRLEFLGDSILSFVISEYLFKNFTNDSEGMLSKKKSILVSRDTLGSVAKDIGLGKFLILSHGEAKTGGRDNIHNLEDTLEAVIGAIFIDSNDINIVKTIILRLFSKFFNLNRDIESSKSRLQEWTQKYFKTLPIYSVEDVKTVNGKDIFTIKLTIGEKYSLTMDGTNIKEVEKSLANELLKNLIDKNEHEG